MNSYNAVQYTTGGPCDGRGFRAGGGGGALFPLAPVTEVALPAVYGGGRAAAEVAEGGGANLDAPLVLEEIEDARPMLDPDPAVVLC